MILDWIEQQWLGWVVIGLVVFVILRLLHFQWMEVDPLTLDWFGLGEEVDWIG